MSPWLVLFQSLNLSLEVSISKWAADPADPTDEIVLLILFVPNLNEVKY